MHSHLKLGAQGLRLAMNLFYKMWEQCNICLAVFKLKLFSEGAGLHREARKAATWPTPHCSLSLKVTKCMKSRVSKPTVSHNILHACGKVNPKGGVSEVCPTAPPVAELGWAAWQLWVLTSPSGPAVVVRSGACATCTCAIIPHSVSIASHLSSQKVGWLWWHRVTWAGSPPRFLCCTCWALLPLDLLRMCNCILLGGTPQLPAPLPGVCSGSCLVSSCTEGMG